MLSTNHLLRLRLAARALIEWRVPSSTNQYKNVFSDLLSIHPYASQLGLDANNRLYQIDDKGILLWYLSETISSSTEIEEMYPSEEILDEISNVALRSLDNLLNYSKYVENDLPLWTGGPTKTGTTNLVFEAVSSGDSRISDVGHRALTSFLVQDERIHAEVVQKVVQKMGEELLERGSPPIKFSELGSAPIISPITSIKRYLVIIQVIVGLLMLYISFLYIKQSPWISTIVVGAVTIILLPALKFYREGVSVGIRELLFLRSRKRQLEVAANLTTNHSNFILPLEDLCGYNPRFLPLLLKSDDEAAYVALKCTHKASDKVAHAILQLLPDPEISMVRREQLFQWLCRIRIVNLSHVKYKIRITKLI